ncbi:MAG: hypothetical protein AMXMBFR84_11990 [Candidatus Hydrogenedentota bacterium]
MTSEANPVTWGLTPFQRDLLLNLIDLPDSIREPLFTANPTEPAIVQVPVEDLELLLDVLTAARDNVAEDSKVFVYYESLHLYAMTMLGMSTGLVDELPPESRKFYDALLEQDPSEIAGLFESIAKRGTLELDPEIEADESELDPDECIAALEGLSLNQLQALLACDVGSDSCPIRLVCGIPVQQYLDTRIVHNVRLILRSIAESNGVAIQSDQQLDSDYIKSIKPSANLSVSGQMAIQDFGVYQEAHIFELYFARLVSEVAGLISRTDDHRMTVTDLGGRLQAPNSVEELYGRLFKAYLKEMNMAVMDDEPECEEVQECAPYALYVLSRLDTGWQPVDRLCSWLLPLPVQMDLEEAEEIDVSILVDFRILMPLSEFGLVESSLDSEGERTVDETYRKTPFFARVLRIAFQDGSAEKN